MSIYKREIWKRWYQKNKAKKKLYMKHYNKRKEVKKRMKIYNKKYLRKNKEYFRNYRKNYPKEYYKQYKEKNKEKIRKQSKKYYLKNKKRILKYMKKYYSIPKNIKKKKIWTKNYFKNVIIKRCIENLKSWEGYIPKKTNCQVCGKFIYFNRKIKVNIIQFDHKNPHNIINRASPTAWLKFNPRTPENEKIWKKADFGMLCLQCNGGIPTKNRKKFLKNLIRYILNIPRTNGIETINEERMPKI